MSKVIFVTLCSAYLLLIESATSLKCRTGIQQMEDQLRKIVQDCKNRYTSDNDYNENSSSKEEDADFSNMDVFNTKFFMTSDSKSSNIQFWKNQNGNRNHGNNQRNSNDQRYSSNYTNENWRNEHGNNHDFSHSDGTARTNYNQMHNKNLESYNKEREQACVIQCFFNELNVVDQRGFPEQHLIIQLMTQNTYNPELQDFVEEAIIECFQYLSSNMRQEKCHFSHDLLICLADKEKERCEDWNE